MRKKGIEKRIIAGGTIIGMILQNMAGMGTYDRYVTEHVCNIYAQENEDTANETDYGYTVMVLYMM